MTLAPADRPSALADVDDDAFAATIAEELPDHDDPEALPGAMAVDDRPLQDLPTIGHVGRYALKYQLGAGGLGTVHAALDPLLSRPIAVKTLHLDASAAERDALEAQLLAEARAAAGLNHPNIVTVYDAGLSEQGVYIAMERLQGRDLRELLADGWRPEPAQAVRIAKRLADALAYAHSRGVIHCDIKPANIFMIGRTQPKLLDFGIARVAQQQGQQALRASIDPADDAVRAARDSAPDIELAAAETVRELGSPYYVAPEQLRGEAIDLRCDVYGVGVVLYELLAGRRAFDGGSLESIRQAVLETDLLPVQRINRQVNAALSAIVERAMARDPARRYRSARQLARALRDWLEDDAIRQAAAPLGGSNAAWALFAGLGLVAALAFWVMKSGALGSAAPAAAIAAANKSARDAKPPPAPVPEPAPALLAMAPVAAPQRVALAVAQTVQVSAPATTRPAPQSQARQRKPAAPLLHAATPAATPAATKGIVQLAISPWGQVEVDGVVAGTTPPLSRLSLPTGKHQIVIRNDDFAPFAATVVVDDEKPVTVRHRFGS